MHGDGTPYNFWHEVKNGARCERCHQDAVGPNATIQAYKVHDRKVSCQVCHSVPYKNAFACHVGKDAKGLAYYKTQKTELNFKIGLNPIASERRPYKFVTLRHIPVHRETFDHYVNNGLTNFDALPTWKLAIPHNIQRKTPQTASCNACHGNEDLFLLESDVPPDEREANKRVMVPKDAIPRPR